MYYVHKKHIMTAQKIEKDSMIPTQIGETLALEDQIALKDCYGNVDIVNEEWLNDNYVLVKKERKQIKPQKSPFEEMYAKQLVEFGSLPNQEEELEYITGTQDLINK
ncbi:hypothetical protein [Bacillus xiapuensis]|uniref:Uncharacterized protein n=1 Tax=Bacillus xiapuensis TaxID=2014075 RepID=A0ABU6NCG3_9BACI|nr:hypothetical protein [Bacillus xiapuensis]